jgi:hypothetical protein
MSVISAEGDFVIRGGAIRHVFVNGRPIREDGEQIADDRRVRPGKVLRGTQTH